LPLEDILAGSPTSLVNQTLGSMNVSPYGGLGTLARDALSSDQLQSLYSLMTAGSGQFGLGIDQQRQWIDQFYRSMLTPNGAAPPTLAGVLGPAFQGNPADPNNPMYLALTGGDPTSQVGRLLGAVQDISALGGMNGIINRGLMEVLQAVGSDYLNQSAQPGSQGANSQFIQFVQRQLPMIARYMGA
jgi:hypothetical protein